MRYYVIFILLICSLGSMASPQTLFEEANQAYQEKAYRTAIEKYQQVLQDGYQSDELLYNLANSYYRNKQIGKAILYYEKVLLKSPSHKDARFNLNIANKQLKDEIDALPPFFLKQWWQGIHRSASSSLWSIFSILLLWIAIGGACLWLIAKERKRKKQGFLVTLTGTILCVFFFLVASSQATYERNSGFGVVTLEKVQLKNAPDEVSPDLLSLHEGIKMAILDQIGDWYKVRLSNGEEGWIKQSEIEKI